MKRPTEDYLLISLFAIKTCVLLQQKRQLNSKSELHLIEKFIMNNFRIAVKMGQKVNLWSTNTIKNIYLSKKVKLAGLVIGPSKEIHSNFKVIQSLIVTTSKTVAEMRKIN